MIKIIVRKIIPDYFINKINLITKQAQNFRSLAIDYGQWTTIRDWNSVDESAVPTPWYTYPTTEYLSHLDLSRMSVFEYGSGNSTLWWAQKTKGVVSVEDDKEWFDKIKKNLTLEKTQYLLKTEKVNYIESATNANDIFIIDGQFRRECADHVVKVGGTSLMIILDNSDWHPETVNFLRIALNWVQIDFHGFGPINNYTWTTSIFINPKRHHELVYVKNLKSKCGLNHVASGDN